ncbi:hypothetical protein PO909_010775 [Leuciscus waleckii]
MDTPTSIKMTTLAIQNLFSYVEEENLAAVKAHLDKFKEVDGRSDNGQTPLMLASEQGSLEIVQELIRRGADVNLEDEGPVILPEMRISYSQNKRVQARQISRSQVELFH